jgi:hypothetical protein
MNLPPSAQQIPAPNVWQRTFTPVFEGYTPTYNAVKYTKAMETLH